MAGKEAARRSLISRRTAAPDAGTIATIQVRASLVAYEHIFPSRSATLTVADRTPVWREIIARARGRERVVLAEEAAESCGYAHFGPSRDLDQNPNVMGELYSIYVAPEHWRQGVGSKLLVCSMDMLACVGFDACTLWVLTANNPARRFYERHAWRLDGNEKHIDQEIMEVRYRTAGLGRGAANIGVKS